MLLGLGLGALLVGGHEQQGSVHEGGTRQHGGHEGLVPGRVHEGYGPEELGIGTAVRALLVGAVRGGALTLRALVERNISVSEADRDSPLQFLGVTVGPLSGEGSGQGRLPMVDVPDHPDIDLGLLRYFHQFSAGASPSGAGLRISSMVLDPYSTTFMLTWTIASEIVFPRMATLFLSPG